MISISLYLFLSHVRFFPPKFQPSERKAQERLQMLTLSLQDLIVPLEVPQISFGEFFLL